VIQFSSFDFPILSADHPPSSKIRAKISALAEKSLPILLAANDETNSEMNPFYRNFSSFPQSPDFSETCPFPHASKMIGPVLFRSRLLFCQKIGLKNVEHFSGICYIIKLIKIICNITVGKKEGIPWIAHFATGAGKPRAFAAEGNPIWAPARIAKATAISFARAATARDFWSRNRKGVVKNNFGQRRGGIWHCKKKGRNLNGRKS
jgi:hypothetical protein